MKIIKIINATPHQIVICSKEGVTQDPKTKQFTASAVEILHTLPPSGIIPRVAMGNTEAEPILGIPVQSVQYGEIEGLPPASPDVYYVVSGLVAAAAVKVNRADCLAPGALVRNSANPSEVLGCLFLQKP
jgi:hypothetical protein